MSGGGGGQLASSIRSRRKLSSRSTSLNSTFDLKQERKRLPFRSNSSDISFRTSYLFIMNLISPLSTPLSIVNIMKELMRLMRMSTWHKIRDMKVMCARKGWGFRHCENNVESRSTLINLK